MSRRNRATVAGMPNPDQIDASLPAPGELYYHLNRALQPNAGSWGMRSGEVERNGGCLP